MVSAGGYECGLEGVEMKERLLVVDMRPNLIPHISRALQRGGL